MQTAAEEEKNTMTALEVTKAMGNGINLGNTMEAYNHKSYLNGSDPSTFETIWGQPITTQEMIDGEEHALNGKGYTSSDDKKCTRMNLYNQWVSKAPDEPRMKDGTAGEASAQIWKADQNQRINTVEITFTFEAM